jgi:hypothetical protein
MVSVAVLLPLRMTLAVSISLRASFTVGLVLLRSCFFGLLGAALGLIFQRSLLLTVMCMLFSASVMTAAMLVFLFSRFRGSVYGLLFLVFH